MLEPSAVSAYFSEIGLSPEIAQVYLSLHTHGPQNVTELARQAGIERTRIHRLIKDLEDSRLVTTEKQGNRTTLRAAPIANLHILLNQKEQEVKEQQDKLWVIERLLANNSLDSPATKVQFYQGAEGLRQMFWNESEATGENLAILYENMQQRTDAKFFARWVRRCNERDLKFRGIICQNFIDMQREWYALRSNERIKNWQARVVPKEVFEVTHSQVIYDNVVAYYMWKDEEIFGVEIYNQQIADAQRRFFEMLWEQSRPVNDLTGSSALAS